MASTCMKRLTRERERFPCNSSEFFVNFKDENLRSFEAYIIGPEDSLYKHKLVKLRFDIPQNYPLVPPKVTFIQHAGDRLHPNLYAEGKVCLSILGTYPGDPWSYSMTIEGVLITIRSLLDNKPFLHEPNRMDDPAFNDYVRYNSWRWLLLDYVERERDPVAKAFLERHLRQNGAEMARELQRQKLDGLAQEFSSPYKRSGTRSGPNYDALLSDLRSILPQREASTPCSLASRTDVRKRRASNDAPSDDQPAKQRRKQELDVVDLTDSP